MAATVLEAIPDTEGHTRHAELKIGDSIIMLDANPLPNPAMQTFYFYVEDTDAVYQQALTAGATSLMEPIDQFYGDRNAGVEDPFGNQWWIATHIEDLSAEEIQKRAQQAYQQDA